MKKNIKEMWIAALTGGKYRQTKNQLRKGNSFCCLGVLCDLAVKSEIGKWDRNNFVSRNGDVEEGTLPPSVRKWAGIKSKFGYTTSDGDLTDLNDEENFKFPAIAKVIEKKG